MIKSVPYDPKHLEEIKVQEKQLSEKPDSIPGQAITIMSDETPIAIFGGYFIAPGVLQAWALLSDEVKKFPLAVTKEFRDAIEFFETERGVRRIQVSVRVGDETSRNWDELLGFHLEGVMRAYGSDGHPYWLLGRLA